jgi:hypothetical protein
MKRLQYHGSFAIRLLFLFFMLATVGCTATYIKATVHDNPLPRIADQAREDWSVERADNNTLRLRNLWPIHSFFTLGYSASYANLYYNAPASELDLQYFLKGYSLVYLFIPITISAEPGSSSWPLKPIMDKQIEDILGWSGATVQSRRNGSWFEPFPQLRPDAGP